MTGEPVCWTSCLVCLQRFSFPLCSRWHPLLCEKHRHLVEFDARIGAALVVAVLLLASPATAQDQLASWATAPNSSAETSWASSAPKRDTTRGLRWAMRAAFVADAISTHIAIDRYNARETMLPSQNPWTIDTLLGSQMVSGTRTVKAFDESDSPRLARVLGWTLIALHGAATAWNIRQMRNAGQIR